MHSVSRDEFEHIFMVTQQAIIHKMRAKLEEQRRARRPQVDAALAFSDAAAALAEAKMDDLRTQAARDREALEALMRVVHGGGHYRNISS